MRMHRIYGEGLLVVLALLSFGGGAWASLQRAAVPASFGVTRVEPKIFSPDIAACVRFHIDNPQSGEIFGRIYDRAGRLVMANLPREVETVLYWDGRDAAGKIVPAGIYFYQIEAESSIINGTVVVAR
jgi:hypothetical protein